MVHRHKRGIHIVRIGNRKLIAKGLTSGPFKDLYHTAMRINWWVFMTAASLVFFAINVVFAILFCLVPGSIANVPEDKPWHVLYFSIETLATVGYGDMHPATDWGHFVASVESFVGVIFSAVLTGMIFSRFSRPRARIIFAQRPVVGTFDGETNLMIRVANARANMISDAVAKVWLLATMINAEGRSFRRFYELKLDRIENPSFVLSWTLFHRIDAESPLYGWDLKRWETTEAGLVVTVQGADESLSQYLRARQVYDWHDIAFGYQYADLLDNDSDGHVVLDYTRFHDIEPEEGDDAATDGGGIATPEIPHRQGEPEQFRG